MLSFNDWKKKEKKTDYEIVKSRSGLPMFIIEPPDSLNNLTSNDDDREVEVIEVDPKSRTVFLMS